MRLDALVVSGGRVQHLLGFAFPGHEILAIFTPNDELGAFGHVIQAMAESTGERDFQYDYISITMHRHDDTKVGRHKWVRNHEDQTWEKVV
jgi:hypothetical protein